MSSLTQDARDQLFDSCSQSINWHGHRTPADLLKVLGPDITADRYVEGGAVAEVEERVADLLGF